MMRSFESTKVEIKKVFFYGEFSHWEMDVYLNGENIGGGTAPTYYGVSDMAADILYEYLKDINRTDWFDDDANEPKRQEIISTTGKKARHRSK